ncbi:MAG: hypothetical protein GOVbin1753_19 [Prokaryotic dsDNA virus sp.]|nr:MAG: hypothetical protein GOVbin1753_19 [Prokaryotic dsDNA virus sp.]|tara:strand:+ start:11066 stop:12961 length:1896 start_codon:yes stop_codon:yes gene_type:complete
MMLNNILKALPSADAAERLLLNDTGLSLLLTQAKGEDKKNIISVRNRAKTLSEGEGIPEGFDNKEYRERAKKLYEELSSMIKEGNVKTQSSLEDKLKIIIEDKDKDGLIKLVGTSSKMSGSTKKKKTTLLKKYKDEILSFIDMDDTDVFFFDTSEFSLVSEKPKSDENWGDKVANIRSRLSSTKVDVDISDDKITLKFPDKTSSSDMKDALFSAQLTDAPSDVTEKIIFKKMGKFTKSPMLEILGEKTSLQVQDKVEAANKKNYSNQVNSSKEALAYLEVIVDKGIRKQMMFMPTPVIQQGSVKVTRNARTQLLTDKPRISSSLRALLTASSFNLKGLMESGFIQGDIKYNSPRLREILEGTDDVQVGGVPADEIEILREKYIKSKKRMKNFIRKLKGTNLNNLNKINNELIQRTPNLFTEEEKEMIMELPANPIGMANGLEQYYGKEVESRVARLLSSVVRAGTAFQKVEGGYKFVTPKGMDFDNMRDLVFGLKVLRQNDELSDKVEGDLQQTLSDYKRGFVLSTSGSPKPADMIHLLYVLDSYYGRTPFRSVARRFKRGEAEESELIKSAKENFTKIINGFVNSVKIKVDDILENKEKYQDSLTMDSDSKAYLMFNKLEEKGVLAREVR